MGEDIRHVLEQQLDALNALYDQNLQTVKQLQATLLDEILPGLADEQAWDEADLERAIEWLQDTRMLCNFRRSNMLNADPDRP